MVDSRDGPDDVSTAVVAEITDRLGRDPLDLDPRLGDVVDPDALEAIVAPLPDGSLPAVTVTFEYSGYAVTVDAEAGVDVRALDA